MKKRQLYFNKSYINGFIVIFALMSLLTLNSCAQNPSNNQPNIVWFIAEDISTQLNAYGDSTAKTPNIDRLANEGIIYTNCYSVSGVCAPSRSALITSSYPTSMGTHNMRTNWATPDKIENYWVPLPEEIKAFTQYLRKDGYFCTNNAKEDYNFNVGLADWDINDKNAHWRDRNREDQPFFSVFTSNTTHESRIWKHKEHPLRVNPDKVMLPPYYPDIPSVRKDVSRSYSNIEEMDQEVGELLEQLEEDNLIDNTVFMFFGDNGGPLPRQKRELYDGGIHVPLIVRYPNKKHAATKCEDMVSFVDFGVSILSLANIPIPEYYHGIPFLGEHKDSVRQYVYASHDRIDKKYDMVRAVRDKRFKYIRNFNTGISCYLEVEYRMQLDMMKDMVKMHKEGKLNDLQNQWFLDHKPIEELYDTWRDPHELVNLADDPMYKAKLDKMRSKLIQWQEEYGDMGFISESSLFKYFWPTGQQPKTAKPIMIQNLNKVSLKCQTPGAHIVYKIVPPGGQKSPPYSIYNNPIKLNTDGYLYCRAERYGFAPSDWVKIPITKQNKHDL